MSAVRPAPICEACGLPVDFLRQLGEAAWRQRTACIQGEIARLRAWCERHEIPWTPKAGAA